MCFEILGTILGECAFQVVRKFAKKSVVQVYTMFRVSLDLTYSDKDLLDKINGTTSGILINSFKNIQNSVAGC